MTFRGRLAGKRAMITGASSGIGRELALALAAEGALVAGCGRDRERIESTREAIERAGGRAVAIGLDVTRPDEIIFAVQGTVEEFGGIDIVVNCAGISEVDGWVPVHEHTQAGWERTFAVDVTAPFLITKATIPYLLEAGGGSMLHISSIAAEVVLAGNSAYGAAKAALNQLSNHIAVEYAAQGIRSNAIMPGEIETPASTRAIALAEQAGEFSRADLLARYPAVRFGLPREIALTAVFLCSDEASFLTGAVIPVDGGYTRV